MRREWLDALERSGCVSEETGWIPRHIMIRRAGRLVAAAPAYIHHSSEGDFSQDWHWADAAMRAGIPYYPKLLITVPFTPCSGRRFLGEDLRKEAEKIAEKENCSGFQILFARENELREARLGIQFHWHNNDYESFDEFLARFDSKTRNQIKREMRAPAGEGITIRTVRGDELSRDPEFWADTMDALHSASVGNLYWGQKWINRAFYLAVLSTMPEDIEIVVAERSSRIIAGAFNVATPTHLYGRYWGCIEEHKFLHFNVALYHSIAECIRLGRKVFEGGAGGGHKYKRGFNPAPTFSEHHFFDARLNAAIGAAITEENRAVAATVR